MLSGWHDYWVLWMFYCKRWITLLASIFLWSSGFATCLNFLHHFDKAEREKFAKIAIDVSLENFYYSIFHSFVDKNENFIFAAQLMTSHTNISSEKQPREDIAHSNNGKQFNWKTDKISEEFDKFHDSVKKEVHCDNIEFNKSLMKFMKLYKKNS